MRGDNAHDSRTDAMRRETIVLRKVVSYNCTFLLPVVQSGDSTSRSANGRWWLQPRNSLTEVSPCHASDVVPHTAAIPPVLLLRVSMKQSSESADVTGFCMELHSLGEDSLLPAKWASSTCWYFRMSFPWLSFIHSADVFWVYVSGLNSGRALQDAVGSHSRGIWASLKIRKGIPTEVPVVPGLKERWELARGKGATVGGGVPTRRSNC